MISWPYKIGAAVAILAVGMSFAYFKGRSAGEIDQLKNSVEAYETRGKVDNETGTLDRYSVCLRLGGLPDECDELRGLDKASPGK